MKKLTNWTDKEIEAFILKVYGGEVSREKLPRDLYNEILRRLTDAVISGFGDGLKIDGGASLLKDFNDNLAVFSAAKTYQQVNDMANFIFDDNGNKTAFSVFKKHADEIFETYNENWLKTELNTAASLASSAKYWLEIWRDKDIFPYLKYVTIGDERVRHDHELLDGIIRKVTDSFWDEYFPPNDWNCRCIVEQLEDAIETDISGMNIPKNPPLFAMNPAKSRFIFDETKHPYLFTRVDERFKTGSKASKPILKPIKKQLK